MCPCCWGNSAPRPVPGAGQPTFAKYTIGWMRRRFPVHTGITLRTGTRPLKTAGIMRI
tara:strand:+ start:118380 stop:118553 length:174 start_codon:yes stop_codon:yes gene_type:complete